MTTKQPAPPKEDLSLYTILDRTETPDGYIVYQLLSTLTGKVIIKVERILKK